MLSDLEKTIAEGRSIGQGRSLFPLFACVPGGAVDVICQRTILTDRCSSLKVFWWC